MSKNPKSAKLTKRIVDSYLPEQGRYMVWDSELAGFGLRIEASGTKTFIVRYRAGSGGRTAQQRFMTIGRYGVLTPEEARKLAKDVLADVSKGFDPAEEKANSRAMTSFQLFAERYLKEEAKLKLKPHTFLNYKGQLYNHIFSAFGNKKLDDVTLNDITKLHRKIGADMPATANRVVDTISSVYRYAQKCGLIERNHNPTKGIESFKENAIERYLTIEELQRLGDALTHAETLGFMPIIDPDKPKSKHAPKNQLPEIFSTHSIAAIRLLLFTGCRLREILHLKWSEINFERGLLFLSDSKTGKKTIILSAPALAILNTLPRISDYVIAGKSFVDAQGKTIHKPKADLKRPWARVTHYAGLDGLRLHDLRHTYASFGAGSGMGLPIIGKLLGHTQASTTQRYAHLDNDPLKIATDSISHRIEAALSNRPSAEIIPIKKA